VKAPKDGDFWNLDLFRLSASGWLLILVCGILVVALMFVVLLILPHDLEAQTRRRWAGIGLLVCLGASAILFAIGRKWLDKVGWPILRPGKDRQDRR